MPTYQYTCTDCGHFFEAVQSFSDDSLTVCPECGGKLRKVYNAVGVVFKGSGFYRTDSRGGAADSSSTTGSESSGSGSGTGSSDSGSKSSGSSSTSPSSSSPSTSSGTGSGSSAKTA
ncbi:MAG TPA: FmdB family zinc ribbon protein [Marmoricola sp.]|nr:FmdB family zinc ribbon protein [Marmoricola sp.]